MRGRRAPRHSAVALRCRAVAWLTAAALLSLFLVQPAHNAFALGDAAALAAPELAAAPGLPGPAGPHDADQCVLCQGAAPARVALQAPVLSLAFAARGPELFIPAPPDALRASSVSGRSAPPRGPPVSFVPSA
jgi:hypothetical protein